MSRSGKLTGAVLLVGCAETHADLRYATGFIAPDPVVFLKARGAASLAVSAMEAGRARATVKGAEVFAPRELGLRGAAERRIERWAVALLRRAGLREAGVDAAFPLRVARALERAGIRLHVCEGGVFPEREVKTEEEVARIRESQRAAVAGMRTAVRMIAGSSIDASGRLRLRGRVLTSERVIAAIGEALYARGCLGRDVIVAGGDQAVDPHETGSGPLRAGEAIVIDIFPRSLSHGYWGDITRTVVRGRPSPALRRQYAAVRAAQARALALVRAGASLPRIHREVQRAFERRGYRNGVERGRAVGFTHGTGHGVGLEIHERPVIGMRPGRLRAGNVVTVEPGLYYPGIGGVRIEDTVVVTARGCMCLAPLEKRFEV